MSSLYADERFTFNNAGKYIVARFSRIAPAYWIAVIVAFLFYMTIPLFSYHMTPLMTLRSMLFMGNQGIFWSIPPEIQFYGFFLLLWYAYGCSKKGNHLWSIIAALISLACIVTQPHWGGLLLPSKLHIFLCGFFAAFLVKKGELKRVVQGVYFQILTTMLFASYAFLYIGGDHIYSDMIFPVLIGLWIAAMSGSTWLTYVFETNTMRLMGAASFSIYLFHDLVLQAFDKTGVFSLASEMVSLAAACLIALAVPVAFHVLVERRLNKTAKAEGLSALKTIEEKYPKLAGLKA